MLHALTRQPSPAIADCELTCIDRTSIDAARVARQHRGYEDALVAAGCTLVPVEPAPAHPDGIFVEDCAVVVAGHAVLTRPGAASRRGEVDSVAAALDGLVEVVGRIAAPATLDGGDVLRLGKVLFVGRSSRSSDEGIRQLAAALAPVGVAVRPVELRAALHLKTAVTAVADDTLLLNPAWVDPAVFAGRRILRVHPDEPFAANTLRVADTLVVAAAHPRAAEACAPHVGRVCPVEVDEIARAEGGVTCCSILVETES